MTGVIIGLSWQIPPLCIALLFIVYTLYVIFLFVVRPYRSGGFDHEKWWIRRECCSCGPVEVLYWRKWTRRFLIPWCFIMDLWCVMWIPLELIILFIVSLISNKDASGALSAIVLWMHILVITGYFVMCGIQYMMGLLWLCVCIGRGKMWYKEEKFVDEPVKIGDDNEAGTEITFGGEDGDIKKGPNGFAYFTRDEYDTWALREIMSGHRRVSVFANPRSGADFIPNETSDYTNEKEEEKDEYSMNGKNVGSERIRGNKGYAATQIDLSSLRSHSHSSPLKDTILSIRDKITKKTALTPITRSLH